MTSSPRLESNQYKQDYNLSRQQKERRVEDLVRATKFFTQNLTVGRRSEKTQGYDTCVIVWTQNLHDLFVQQTGFTTVVGTGKQYACVYEYHVYYCRRHLAI